jgi:putative ABC transport system permease protein
MSLIREIGAATAMNVKAIPSRLGSTFVTIVGVATTVAVMISLLAIGAGLMQTAGRNIDPSRVVILSDGAQAEYTSSISRTAVEQIAQAPGVRRDAQGQPIVQPMALAVVEVERKSDGSMANVGFRGAGPMNQLIDPAIKVTEGRMYRPAVHELIVGTKARDQFKDMDIGDKLALRGSEWTVVGIFEADGGIAESALMADADTVLAAFERPNFQSAEALLTSPAALTAFKDALSANPQLSVEVKTMKTYMADQMEQLTSVLNFVGYFVGGVMAVGAIIASIITMYAAVETRTREIATLRALGFGGMAIVTSVMVESLLLAIPGALLGAAATWVVFNGRDISTVGLTFPLAVTPPLVVAGIVLSVVIGLIGGFFPAIRAARIPVAEALRAN